MGIRSITRTVSIPGLGLGRLVLGQVLGWGVRTANGAGLIGVLVGSGESVRGHVSDFAMAIPNGFRALGHYVHGGRHLDQFARTAQYLSEEAPTVAELQSTMAGSRSWLNRFDLARNSIREGLAELAEAEIILGTSDVRWGLTHMPPRAELDTLVARANAIVEPTIGYLAEVQLDPLMQAAVNVSDNLARDEILGTALTMVALGIMVWIGGSYVCTMWVRRGLPGFMGRAWMRAGRAAYPGWFDENRGAVLAALGLEGRGPEVPGDAEPDDSTRPEGSSTRGVPPPRPTRPVP